MKNDNSFIRHRFSQFKQTYLNTELEFRLRVFNMLALGGISISFTMAVISLFFGNGIPTVVLNATSGILAAILLRYTNRSGRYQLCYVLAIIPVFLFFFPLMFFEGGGYCSGMPGFFIFAVIFTVFMLDGKKMLLFAGLELAVYSGCCIVAYLIPDTVTPLRGEKNIVTDVIIGFVVASVVTGTTLFFLLRLYQNQQKKLDEQNTILAYMNKTKTEFMSNVSHEMKTPLTVISVDIQRAVDMMENSDAFVESDDAVILLNKAQEEIMRLSGIITGMLNLASMRENIDKKAVYFSAFLRNCADVWDMTTRRQGNELHTDIPVELPKVFCNVDLMAQVMSNLLQNANTYTKGGQITIRAWSECGKNKVTVSDTGGGILEELLPHVFERGVSGGKGTGYGLYLCKIILESHGGDIGIESELGKGTKVTFTIPVYEGQL
ncbi:MAG: HAMP domain-containing sensor histidine kinase [Muricomes sp.]